MATYSARLRGAPALTRDGIVEAYIRLADREGPEAVSLRRLGIELGADPTAVYRHFRNKEELLQAVADRLLKEVVDRLRPGGDWRRDLRTLALEARAVYLAHPRLARVIATSADPLPSNSRLAEHVLRALRKAGLSEREAALGFEALESYVAGTSSLDAEVDEDVLAGWRRSFASLPRREFPNAVAVARHLYRRSDEAFRFGLDLLLDAVAARARRARP